MIRTFLLILTFVVALAAIAPQGRASTERIAAIVNEDAISISDVNDRLRLVIGSSGLPNSKEIREKLTPQVIGSLIEEQIKMQEAGRLEITVAQEEIDQGFGTVAAQNKISPEKFQTMLQRGGISIESMKRQIESQIAWSKVVQRQLRPQVIVSDADVDDMVERFHGNKGTKEYLIAEIFLPVDETSQESNVRQVANRLVGQIKNGKSPFYKLAQQFSKSAGSTQGGDLGWIQQGQLPEELDVVLKTLEKDQVSSAIRSLAGYHILYLREKRTISDETIPARDQIVNTLGTERLERLQRRYLLDLKATAFIENRVGS